MRKCRHLVCTPVDDQAASDPTKIYECTACGRLLTALFWQTPGAPTRDLVPR